MTMRLDSRQSRQRSVLDQLSNSTDLRLDVLMNLINDELTMPLRMSADATPSRNLNIGAIEVQTLDGSNGTGRKRTIQPIGNLLPSFTAGYMTFPAATDGSITASGFSFQTPYTLRDGNNASIANGNYVKVMIALNSLGQVVLSFGVQGNSESLATLPSALSGTLALGYVVLQNHISGVIQNVTDANIRQFSGGGGGGGSGASSKQVTQASHGFKVGNVVYLNSSGVYVLAQADTGIKSEAVGMVSNIVTTSIFEVTELGYVSGIDVANVNEGGGNLTVGEVYFLSAANPGKIVVNEPAVIGNISKPMLIADSTTSGYVLNHRGNVIGGTNARTEVSLANAGSTLVYTPPAGMEAAELKGWVYINGTTKYRFHLSAQFAKNGLDNDWNISYQTTGDTPPAGFAVTIASNGNVSITMPNIGGYSSAKVNYSINGPAVGATFPLNVDSTKVNFTDIQASTAAGISFKEDGGTLTGSISDAGAWTLGPSSGLTAGHTVRAATNSSTALFSFLNTGTADVRVSMASASGAGTASFSNDSPTAAGFDWRQGGSTILGQVSGAGAWTLGNSTANVTHAISSNKTDGDMLVIRNYDTTTSSDARSPIQIMKGSGTTSSAQRYVRFLYSSGTDNGFITAATGTTVAFAGASDRRIKKDIAPLDGALERILQLNPVSFKLKASDEECTGFIAQELAEVFPKMVFKSDDGAGDNLPEGQEPWTVTEAGMVVQLVKAIQELKQQLDDTKEELADLKSKL